MAAVCGQRINPYSVNFTNVSTADEFSTSCYRIELRRGRYNGAVWVWMRVTVTYPNNYIMGDIVEMKTPCGTAYKLPYGSGNNTILGASRCTEAICIGETHNPAYITYTGAAYGNVGTKTARVF